MRWCLSKCGYFSLLLACWWPHFSNAQNLETLGEYRIAVIAGMDAPIALQGFYYGLHLAQTQLQQRYSIEINFEHITLAAQASDDSSVQQLQRFIEDLPAAVIIATTTALPSAWQTLLAQSGIPQINIQSFASDAVDKGEMLVVDEIGAGRIAARQLLQALHRRGTVAILDTGNCPVTAARMQGVLDVFGKRQAYTIIHTEPNPHAANKALIEAIANDRDQRIRGWLCLDDWAFRSAMTPLWDLARTPAVAIMSHPSGTAALRSGQLHGVVLHPWHELGNEALHRLIYQLHERTGERKQQREFHPQWYSRKEIGKLEAQWRDWLRQTL
jgi:DNA-binding LacI/PurR family transcriptional regulator